MVKTDYGPHEHGDGEGLIWRWCKAVVLVERDYGLH